MKCNVGNSDKIVRLLIAVVAAGAAFVVPGGLLPTILLVVAAIMAVTALVSFCPIYAAIGINTCKISDGRPSTSAN